MESKQARLTGAEREFGLALDHLMHTHGWRNLDLAERSKPRPGAEPRFRSSAVSEWRCLRILPTGLRMYQIAELFGVSLRQMLSLGSVLAQCLDLKASEEIRSRMIQLAHESQEWPELAEHCAAWEDEPLEALVAHLGSVLKGRKKETTNGDS